MIDDNTSCDDNAVGKSEWRWWYNDVYIINYTYVNDVNKELKL